MSEKRKRKYRAHTAAQEGEPRSGLWSGIKMIGVALLIAFFVTRFVLSATVVEGISMHETLQDQDRLLVLKLGISASRVKRGDIVVFRAPDAPDRNYVKRVIGLPNEFVQIEGGRVYINGERLPEDYINTEYTRTSDATVWVVGENELFVLGDNRREGESKDSRIFGPISGDSLVGWAFFRFYPWSAMGGL